MAVTVAYLQGTEQRPPSRRQPWTIGPLAKAAGVNVEAVRFYQRNGLISELDRPRRGHTPLWATCHSALGGLVRLRDLGAGPNRTEIMQAWSAKVCAEVSAILADVAHRSH